MIKLHIYSSNVISSLNTYKDNLKEDKKRKKHLEVSNKVYEIFLKKRGGKKKILYKPNEKKQSKKEKLQSNCNLRATVYKY